MNDQSLTCIDCGSEFVFSTGEQKFFEQQGFSNPPRRCRNCRQARKGGASSPSRGQSPRELHAATCGQCGNPTQVPFRPRGDRPVYCRDCFSQRGPRFV